LRSAIGSSPSTFDDHGTFAHVETPTGYVVVLASVALDPEIRTPDSQETS
jgi:hypothetical protein